MTLTLSTCSLPSNVIKLTIKKYENTIKIAKNNKTFYALTLLNEICTCKQLKTDHSIYPRTIQCNDLKPANCETCEALKIVNASLEKIAR